MMALLLKPGPESSGWSNDKSISRRYLATRAGLLEHQRHRDQHVRVIWGVVKQIGENLRLSFEPATQYLRARTGVAQ